MKELDFLTNKKKEAKDNPELAAEQQPGKLGWSPEIKDRLKTWRSRFFSSEKNDTEVIATDLIQSEVITYFDWKKNIVILILAVSVGILMLLGSNKLLSNWQVSRQKAIIQIENTTNDLNLQAAKAESNLAKIDLLQKKMDLTKVLLDKHIYWTNFFDFLEKNTLAEVFYQGSFSGDTKGDYELLAQAKDFRYLASQIDQLRSSSMVISANSDGGEINGLDKASRVLNFKLDLKMNPAIFYKTDSN